MSKTMTTTTPTATIIAKGRRASTATLDPALVNGTVTQDGHGGSAISFDASQTWRDGLAGIRRSAGLAAFAAVMLLQSRGISDVAESGKRAGLFRITDTPAFKSAVAEHGDKESTVRRYIQAAGDVKTAGGVESINPTTMAEALAAIVNRTRGAAAATGAEGAEDGAAEGGPKTDGQRTIDALNNALKYGERGNVLTKSQIRSLKSILAGVLAAS